MIKIKKVLNILLVGILFTSSIGCVANNQTPVAGEIPSPYDLVSETTLFDYLEDLTSIQPNSGWRSAGTKGEKEAFTYVENTLEGFTALQSAGMELERQSFEVFLSTEIWDSELTLSIKGKQYDIPAEGLRGSRFDRALASYFDSDGRIGDSESNPQHASGGVLVVRDDETLYHLTAAQVKDRILFMDYSLIDYTVLKGNADASRQGENTYRIMNLVDQGLAGVVIMVKYSNVDGESRGTVLGDGGTFQNQVPTRRVPFLFVRLEDMQPAGIKDWDDLAKIESASMLLDSDATCPGTSGNLVVRIPGVDGSHAVILGAHLDSPNSPGAFDDGSGSAALLEVARVLNASQIPPAVDLYLAWFGGHEIGVYGSAYFAATHQELLDRTLAQVQMDGLGHPLNGVTSSITMMVTSYGRFGEEQVPLAEFLSDAALDLGISLDLYIEYGLIADNSSFDMFNVPNVFLGYLNKNDWQTKGSTFNHYSNHWHDPYETVAVAREVGDVFVDMTRVMLIAALQIDQAVGEMRVTPSPQARAVVVASHTDPASAVTSLLRNLGMALAWHGYDVDLVPFGTPVTAQDVLDADLVILPPSMSLPGDGNTWQEDEITVLNQYVLDGGFLLVTNAAHTFIMARQTNNPNLGKRSLNELLSPMGIEFSMLSAYQEDIALAVADHPLTLEAGYLAYYSNDVVAMRVNNGLELVRAGGTPVVALVDYGENGGQVLVVSEIGLLQADSPFAKNFQFINNIIRYLSNQ